MNAKNPFEKNPLFEDGAEEEGTPAVLEAEDIKEDTTVKEEKKEAQAKETKKVSEPKQKSNTPKSSEKKMTPSQERDLLKEQVEQLRLKLETKADATDIKVFKDTVLAEDGPGGQTRLVSDGRTLVNKDWRITKDGLRVLVGRSSMQAQTHFQIPVSLLASLADLLGHFDQVKDA